MKAMVRLALGMSCLGLQLASKHQVEGFVSTAATTGSVGRASQQQRVVSSRNVNHRSSGGGGSSSSSSRGVLFQERRERLPSSSCRTTTCRRMMNAGFGQQQEGDSGASSRKASKKKGKGKKTAKKAGGAPETAEAEGEKKGTGKRQLFMQFTCNRCDGVSQYMINKEAYEDGIVICTCQHCGVKHLIADNLKKMDVPAFGNNIEEYMQTTGTPDEVTTGRAPGLTPDLVEKFDVAMGKDGVLTLSPKVGTDVDEPSSSSSSSSHSSSP